MFKKVLFAIYFLIPLRKKTANDNAKPNLPHM